MTTREKKWLLFLGAVAVVCLPFLPIWGGGREARSSLNTDEDLAYVKPGSTGPVPAVRIPNLRLDLLQQPRFRFTSERNLFTMPPRQADTQQDFGDYDVVDSQTDVDNGDEQEIEEDSVQVRPRLTDYEVVGIVEVGDRKIAVFTWRGAEQFQGSVGSVINETFEIREIEDTYVMIIVLNGGFEQRLRLKPPVGLSSEGE